MPYFFCIKKTIISILFLITSIVSYSQTNVANSYLSGGNARVVEITNGIGTTVFGSDLTADCSAGWEPQGVLCNSSNANSQTVSTKTNNQSGATWSVLPFQNDSAVGVLVIDFGESQQIDLLQVYQMFSDGKVTLVYFDAHPSKIERPLSTDNDWVSIGASYIGAGSISGNTVTQPTNIPIASVNTRYLRVSAFNTGTYGDLNYIELRTIKVFGTAPTTQWKTQVYTGDDKTLADLQVTGSNILWYNTVSGGSTLSTTTNLVDETTYYASQTVNGIESIARVSIKVNRISDNSQLLPFGSTINNLVTTPSTGGAFTYSKWFSAAIGGNRLIETEVLSTNTYYVEQYSENLVANLASIGLAYPYDVAVDISGDMYIADLGNDVIKKANNDGSNIQTIGSGFNAPTGITVDASGTVYVVDSGNNAIKKMNSDGSNIQILGSGFNDPLGIAIDASGTIYVTDSNGVKKMNNDGTNIQTIGSGFNVPFGIAVDASGTIYVSDIDEIKKMNNDGSNIQIIGSGFNQPAGVAVDGLGYIFVADVNNNAIKKMNKDGTNIHSLGTPFEFDFPYGVTVDTSGNVYVADTGNNAIKRVGNITTSNRVPVTVNIPPLAPPLTNWTTQVYTGNNKTLAELQVIGENITWYDTPIGGNVLSINTVLVDETTYYASQTISGFESNLRTAITVNRISNDTQFMSPSNTINNLISAPSEGTVAQWYNSPIGGTLLSDTDTFNIGTYHIQQYNDESITALGTGFSLHNQVAVDALGNIYVADYGNHAIKKMNNDGTYIQTIGSGFVAPSGVSV
ncbi:MAG: hypothetical protein KBT69_05315, partial [Oceanihabitans sp.]|nr:hypothetical protein [Oceanihabitans sp.]